MIEFAVLLAQLDTLNPLGPMPPVSKTTGLAVRELMLIGGVILALCLLLILGASLYVRRSRRRRRHERHPESGPVAQDPTPSRRHPRHRHRHRRRHHSQEERGKNPSLAETGGLPPLRSESSPNPHE